MTDQPIPHPRDEERLERLVDVDPRPLDERGPSRSAGALVFAAALLACVAAILLGLSLIFR